MTLGVYVWKSTMDARWMASAASARQTGPTSAAKHFYAIATRYGTSWQRVLDMNPQVAGGCEEVMRSGKVVGTFCKLMPGDDVCVVPYLRAAVCDQVAGPIPLCRGAPPSFVS